MSPIAQVVLALILLAIAWPVGALIGKLYVYLVERDQQRFAEKLAREFPKPRSSGKVVSRGMPPDDWQKLHRDGVVRADLNRAITKMLRESKTRHP